MNNHVSRPRHAEKGCMWTRLFPEHNQMAMVKDSHRRIEQEAWRRTLISFTVLFSASEGASVSIEYISRSGSYTTDSQALRLSATLMAAGVEILSVSCGKPPPHASTRSCVSQTLALLGYAGPVLLSTS